MVMMLDSMITCINLLFFLNKLFSLNMKKAIIFIMIFKRTKKIKLNQLIEVDQIIYFLLTLIFICDVVFIY